MIWVFYFFAAVLVWLSFKSFTGGVKYLRYFRQELAKPHSDFTPFVSVIAPCKGVDEGFAENIAALYDQEYPGFEIVFVVDDEGDPCVSVIRDILDGRGVETQQRLGEIVVAPKATTSSQKVENLREGVLHTEPRSEVLVFVDSDARPSKDWLRSLVAPLEDNRVGASTGYRWFISEARTFANEMVSAWNASIASALGPELGSNFTWGGSTAIRRETFERLGISQRWQGVVSDDFVLAETIRKAGHDIVFVPQALTASFLNVSLRGMLEFTNRQMKLTRVYAPRLWLMTLFGTGLFNGVLIAALFIVILSRVNGVAVWVSIAVLAAVTVFSVGKASLRLAAVRLVLPQYACELQHQRWTQNTLWAVTGALFFVNSLAALFSRRITWRGIEYELKSPTETVIISRK